jgi:hypothetical protein
LLKPTLIAKKTNSARAPLRLGGNEEVRRLLGQLSNVGRPDKYAGKRKKSRLKGALWMDLRTDLDSPDGTQVTTHDISPGGIGFWVRKKVEIGAIMYLRDCTDSLPRPWLKVRITHCINGLKGYLIGGEFLFD